MDFSLFNILSPAALKDISGLPKVLIFRSCRDEQLDSLITRVKGMNETGIIDIVCHQNKEAKLKKDSRIADVIIYPSECSFTVKNTSQEVYKRIKEGNYTAIIIPFNNPELVGYEEMLRLVNSFKKFKVSKFIGYTCYQRFYVLYLNLRLRKMVEFSLATIIKLILGTYILIKGFHYNEKMGLPLNDT